MGKPKAGREVAANEAKAMARSLRASPRKVDTVCGLIRGKSAERAIADLTFSKRRVAGEVKKVLQSAVANAENNHQLDVDRLYVAEASVGKSIVMKRFRPRARGQVGPIDKPFSRLTIVVREGEESA